MSLQTNCLLLLITILISANYILATIVQTTNGAVRGGRGTTIGLGLPYFYYKGIYYAEPPVSKLRFQAPVPKRNWPGVLDATVDGPACIQHSDPVDGVEDCLSLNVYTPTEPSNSCQLLPVMIWIYGGGFEGGNASYAAYGPDYFLEKNVIVVTVNYRLGIWGFFSTGDTNAPGNAGLKDQLLAMKWVKNNIALFCGNPNRVTIAGQSAGSASVAYHLQSRQSQGFFHGAIMESGLSLCLWALSRNISEVVKKVAEDLGISTENSYEMIQGLQDVNVTTLQKSAASATLDWYVKNNPRDGLVFGPVSEPDHPDAFFTGSSYSHLENGQFAQVPILMGFNTLEGTFDFDPILRVFLVQYDLELTKLLPIDANVVPSDQELAGEKIKEFYFGSVPIAAANLKLMRYLSDDQFVRPIIQFARLIQQWVSVHLYRFSYQGGLWGIYNRTDPGVTHSEELGYLWRSYYAPLRDHDLVVRSRMVIMWTNFIKYGNPTPIQDPQLQYIDWSTFGTQRRFLDIGEDLVMGQEPSKPNITFWDNFYSAYGNPPYNTY